MLQQLLQHVGPDIRRQASIMQELLVLRVAVTPMAWLIITG
jgi:hypothetical protein